ncbi:hypothetical protein EUGRSUZ_H01421 [Eucalyptus grandis]|uniref:Uncharacterized protein n=2 Tax=Eucalyptus grandis TaxID=71139 RepID=A0ACC3JP23_EUCGR|nr:hypothetical protein EUGRSUZ_H01421 [Eucalyptus grandis]
MLVYMEKGTAIVSASGSSDRNLSTSAIMERIPSRWPRPVWHPPWKNYRVKVLNKLASARASGAGSGSRVLTDLVEGLEEAAVAVELRLKINQSHPDLKGGSSRDYGEAVLKHLENSIDLDPKLQKAPVNYEGVRVSGFGGWFLLRLFMILFFLLTLRHQLTMTL